MAIPWKKVFKNLLIILGIGSFDVALEIGVDMATSNKNLDFQAQRQQAMEELSLMMKEQMNEYFNFIKEIQTTLLKLFARRDAEAEKEKPQPQISTPTVPSK